MKSQPDISGAHSRSGLSDDSGSAERTPMPSILNPVLKKTKKELELAARRKSIDKQKADNSKVDVKAQLFPQISMSYKTYGQFERDPLLAAEEEKNSKGAS